jgi:sulfate transport system substrate-binding protein
VLLSWENEAYLTIDEFGPNFDIVYPSSSILAEPPVAAGGQERRPPQDPHRGRGLPELPLQPAAQEIIAKHHFRRANAQVRPSTRGFKQLPLRQHQRFGGWAKAQRPHFADGGVFDKIYKP